MDCTHVNSESTGRRPLLTVLIATLTVVQCGCAAFTNPVANGLPVILVPDELRAESIEGKVSIPLQYLRRKPDNAYRLAGGDVLAIFIEGILGNRNEAPPVNFPEQGDFPPALGFPIPIRTDGTLPLPLVDPLDVTGLTLGEAERKIIETYTSGPNPLLNPGRERIIVTLIRPRQVRVVVFRQDSPAEGVGLQVGGRLLSTRGIGGGGEFITGGARRGTGTIVDLAANENDVLHALAKTGGLPGLDAKNEVVIMRGYPDAMDGLVEMPPVSAPDEESESAEIIRIPLRIEPGQAPEISPKDVILNPGDIVFIEAREADVFYTAGLMPTGEYPLPRDYDLSVLEAISLVGGPLINGGVNVNNLNGLIVLPGMGAPSPSLVTVLRRTPDGRQVPILVDLREAFRDPREDLIVMPGDIIVLQETRGQAVARYIKDVTTFRIFVELLKSGSSLGTGDVIVP